MIFLFSLIVFGCSGSFFDISKPTTTLKLVNYSQLSGWQDEDFVDSIETFLRSCNFINRKEEKDMARNLDKTINLNKSDKSFFDSINNQLFDICLLADGSRLATENKRKAFFEENFQPYLVTYNKSEASHFTGYYEPILNGSLSRHNEFQYPIYGLPDDVISIDLGLFSRDLKNKKITGRLEGNKIIPYFSRKEIEDGALANRGLEIIWVDNPIDLFFLHIQGSGRILLAESNKEVRVSFSGKNGHEYFAIGRELVKIGAIEKKRISLQSITNWLEQNPDKITDIFNKNPSYIFFVMEDVVSRGPKGAQGSALSPGRSLAIDNSIFNYGYPFWISVNDRENKGKAILKALVFGQDTGSAIKGSLRADIFFGSGPMAKIQAGTMNNFGQLFILLPRF